MSSRSRAVSLPLSCCFCGGVAPAGLQRRAPAPPQLLDPVLDGAFDSRRRGLLLGLRHAAESSGERPRSAGLAHAASDGPAGGLPAAASRCTIRIVTIAFVRPRSGEVGNPHAGIGPVRVASRPRRGAGAGRARRTCRVAATPPSGSGRSRAARCRSPASRRRARGRTARRRNGSARFDKCWIGLVRACGEGARARQRMRAAPGGGEEASRPRRTAVTSGARRCVFARDRTLAAARGSVHVDPAAGAPVRRRDRGRGTARRRGSDAAPRGR